MITATIESPTDADDPGPRPAGEPGAPATRRGPSRETLLYLALLAVAFAVSLAWSWLLGNLGPF